MLFAVAAVLGLSFVPVALLRWLPPPTTAFMIVSRFADPATGRGCERVAYDWVPWREIAPSLPIAVLVAEDQRFLEHDGFDFDAIADAVQDRLDGRRLRGASTVSQQVAKNLFLWPGRSFVRKGLEAWLTVWIEALWPKRRILEVHLNVAQFGPCLFGAEAASRRFFGHGADALGPDQSALLAAALPDPARLRVDAPGPFMRERARRIRREMRWPGGPAFLQGIEAR